MMRANCVALGFFDGVHIAHQKLIETAVDTAKSQGLNAIVLTFDKSPAWIVSGKKECYLTLGEQKEQLISSLGASTHFLPLTGELLSMDAEAFVRDILIGQYNIKYAVCGYNYTFGKDRSGNGEVLSALGKKYGFSVKIIPGVMVGNEEVSSSRIRKLVSLGNVKEASVLLGRNFSADGVVVRGKQLGKEIGFPTANIFFDERMVFPKTGVYKTIAVIDGKPFDAITNIGINPTVGGEKLRSETHIPMLDENLYGKKITIEFVDFIRNEIKFDTLDKLTEQIKKDLYTIKRKEELE